MCSCALATLALPHPLLSTPFHLNFQPLQIFKVELKSTVLADAVAVLAECWLARAGVSQDATTSAEGGAEAGGPHAAIREATWVLATLQALSRGGRFALSAKLLPGKVTQALHGLLAELADAAAASRDAGEALDGSAVHEIAAVYGLGEQGYEVV